MSGLSDYLSLDLIRFPGRSMPISITRGVTLPKLIRIAVSAGLLPYTALDRRRGSGGIRAGVNRIARPAHGRRDG